jgi:hypothetical protein
MFLGGKEFRNQMLEKMEGKLGRHAPSGWMNQGTSLAFKVALIHSPNFIT